MLAQMQRGEELEPEASRRDEDCWSWFKKEMGEQD